MDGELPEEETDSRGAALGVARRRAATGLWHGSLGWVPGGARASSAGTMGGGDGECGGAARTAPSRGPALRGHTYVRVRTSAYDVRVRTSACDARVRTVRVRTAHACARRRATLRTYVTTYVRTYRGSPGPRWRGSRWGQTAKTGCEAHSQDPDSKARARPRAAPLRERRGGVEAAQPEGGGEGHAGAGGPPALRTPGGGGTRSGASSRGWRRPRTGGARPRRGLLAPLARGGGASRRLGRGRSGRRPAARSAGGGGVQPRAARWGGARELGLRGRVPKKEKHIQNLVVTLYTRRSWGFFPYSCAKISAEG